MARPRRRAWLRDELILALDLYIRIGKAAPVESRHKVSELLRALPIERELTADPKFRSEKAVSYKLHNFVAIDPNDPTDGFPHGGTGDAEVWEEFAHDPVRLAATAASIVADIESGASEPVLVSDDEEDVDAPEGRLLTVRHRQRERNRKLVTTKKKRAVERHGYIACEACGFDFGERYGERGEGFIECHHTVAVKDLKPDSRTRLSDLALLCSNCHRIVHRKTPWLTIPELAALLSEHHAAPII
jgi:5-methylcytosine-specific restriction protein A